MEKISLVSSQYPSVILMNKEQTSVDSSLNNGHSADLALMFAVWLQGSYNCLLGQNLDR